MEALFGIQDLTTAKQWSATSKDIHENSTKEAMCTGEGLKK